MKKAKIIKTTEKNAEESRAQVGISRNLQTWLMIISVALAAIGTTAVIIFEFNGQITEGFRQQALVINQNHANLAAKADADLKALYLRQDEDRRELFGVIEHRRIETDQDLEDQRKELHQIKLDIQADPKSP